MGALEGWAGGLGAADAGGGRALAPGSQEGPS